MTDTIRSTRPARAAIAAVLAFSATPLLAQEIVAPPPVMPSATAPVDATPPASDAPLFTPSQPVVQQTPPVDQRIAEASAAVEAERMAERPAPRAERPTQRAQRIAPATAAADRPAPVAAPEPAIAPAPAAAPRQQATDDVAQPAPAIRQPATAAEAARTDDALLWALGGGALLLLGIGGTALMRRRRGDAPAHNVHEEAPVAMPLTPQIAPPPAAPAPVRPVLARASADADLDAMVAAPPSADNPFTTRTKRLRRAKFLLAQREAAAMPHPAPQTIDAEPADVPAREDRSQTVYRFGGEPVRPGTLRPSRR